MICNDIWQFFLKKKAKVSSYFDMTTRQRYFRIKNYIVDVMIFVVVDIIL